MGKAENLRRAKKLKEAKRQREMEAELQSSMNSDVQKLAYRHNFKNEECFPQNESSKKYSAIILEFLNPFLDGQDPESEIKLKIAIGVCAWNIAVEKQLAMDTEKGTKEFRKLLDKIEFGQELFDELLAHKKANFSDHIFIVPDFIIGKASKGQVQLSVVATLPEPKQAKY